MMIELAYKGLFPEKEYNYNGELNYSDKFNDYNANVRLQGNKIFLSLSRKWEDISEDIKIGLIQSLLVKLFNVKKTTLEMELYSIFLKKVHQSIPKTKSDPVLLDSFNRVNEKYFSGFVNLTNLEWGQMSRRKLGSYEYGTDTITLSKVLMKVERELLDYVMYHEMLHKKYKFKSKNGRSFHHTTEFRTAERAFENSGGMERRLRGGLRKKTCFDWINF